MYAVNAMHSQIAVRESLWNLLLINELLQVATPLLLAYHRNDAQGLVECDLIEALEYIITLPDNDSVVRYLALQNMLQCLQGFQGQGFPFFEKKFLNAITVLVRPAIRSLALEAALMTSPLKTEWAGLLANSSSVQAMLPINQNSIPARWLGACTTCLRDPWNHQCS